MEVLSGIDVILQVGEERIEVGSEEECESCRRGLCRRVFECGLCVHLLDIVGVVVEFLAVDYSGGEVGVRDYERSEELIFVGDPFHAFVHLFALGASLAEILHIAVGKHVVECAVTFLKHASGFVAAHLLMPVEVDRCHARRYDLLHALLHDLHAGCIAFGRECIAESPAGAVAEIEHHGHGRVTFGYGSEVELACVEPLCGGGEHEAVAVGGRIHQRKRCGVVALVVVEPCFADSASFGGYLEGDVGVAECDGALLSLEVACEALIACDGGH